MKNKITAILPMRAGSQRVKSKNELDDDYMKMVKDKHVKQNKFINDNSAPWFRYYYEYKFND